jgi:hypothetical protein
MAPWLAGGTSTDIALLRQIGELVGPMRSRSCDC